MILEHLRSEVVWYLLIGFVLVSIGLLSSLLKRLPVTTSILYLAVGFAIGRHGLGVVSFDLLRNAKLFEHLTEIVVIVSLFVAGLKLRVPFTDRRWIPPLRLATLSMAITVGLIAAFVFFVLDLPWGAGVLLGFHEIGGSGIRWLGIDVVWAVVAGLGVGWLCGQGISMLVLYVRKKHADSVILDDFLGIGLIALAYGIAHVLHAYGFLAVFAAGLAMRKIEEGGEKNSRAVLDFTEQMERAGEVVTVIFLGSMVNLDVPWNRDLLLVPAIFLVVRPVAVYIGLIGEPMERNEKALTAWFGIRGIGSVYYLAYAFGKGVSGDLAERLANLTLLVVFTSIFLHGVSALPFMNLYQKQKAA